ncbi:MAG: dihydrolipoyl dehydrogenase [Candidatus Margulisbacteria bacterium]|jgi:dihydrolipoamide dehydrogenase|nr:dihydrolipoyl dehydrogenase [Candidatus Margulisiibacteriota bacterium]
MSNKFDLIVLGGGPGGYVAAIRAAQLGAKVALIEKDKVGGTCLNRGCIPTKALIAGTNLLEKIRKADSFGITAKEISIDPAKLVERKNVVVGKIVNNLHKLIVGKGITVIQGEGKVLGPGKVEIENVERRTWSIESRALILATGSVPTCLPGMAFDGNRFLSSDDALELKTVPEQLNIVGGGVIGIHFAMIYSALGTAVTIYEALPDILQGIDGDVVAMVRRVLARRRVEVLTGTRFDPTQTKEMTLVCVGRTPTTPGIKVNEKMETGTPGVYAVGDLVSRKQLAHVAYEQGEIAAENALGGNRTFSYDCVPIGIYTNPEIASVGVTEQEARVIGSRVIVGKFPMAALGIAQAMGEIEGFVKVVADENGKLLGVHILGAEATSLIGIAALAMRSGLTVDKLGATFQSHPSYPEALQEASLAALGRAIHL